MPSDQEQVAQALHDVIPPLLSAMDGLGHASRHLHPPELQSLVEAILPLRGELPQAAERLRAAEWPAPVDELRRILLAAADETLAGYQGLETCPSQDEPMTGAFRAMRHATLAREALYPAAASLKPISRFFLDDAHREDKALVDRIAAADASRDNVGILHAANDRGQRGGFSLYVPEYYEDSREWPLVIALHGGSGHGRDFLWTWLRAARGHGAIVLSPSSRERTWSLMGGDVDSANINAMIDAVVAGWKIDRSRVLLTGMSDGATFAMIAGLRNTIPAVTHLAPVAASFHPAMLGFAEDGRPKGMPIYYVHGALDWMFPVEVARTARDTLTEAGALLEYREIPDLSHTYPREENARMLEWLLG